MPELKELTSLSAGELRKELEARQAKKAGGQAAREPDRELRDFDDATIVNALKSNQKVIYGTDNRSDLFNLQPGPNLDDADSVVALFNAGSVTDNGNGTSTLQTQNFGTSRNLCAGERFREQPTGAFCSGFLVAPDMIATAGHCVNASNVTSVRFVFGFRMRNATTAETVISNAEIYRGVAVVGRQEVGNGPDWAVVRIDRPVTNHRIARIRQTGRIADTQAVHVIGHPVGLPTKFAGSAAVRDNQPAAFFVANLDTYGGNSGSPVFNSTTHEVEGILVRGETDFVQQGTCNVSLVCPDTGCRGEDCTRTTEFAQLVSAAFVHLSPIAGHPTQADIDFTTLGFPAKFAVAGDFDGDGRQEIAAAPEAGGSAGNDFWVMKFDTQSQTWRHLSPIAGHPTQADIDISGLGIPAKFAVAGDFDGDGRQEIAVAPEAGGSAGNDFWVMKFDTQSRSWRHLSPIPGHPTQADMDISGLGIAAKFAIAGDFDGDGRQEIAVAPEAGGSAGNDFWVMRFDTQSRSWRHLSPIAGHPMGADMDVSGLGFAAKFAVAGDFDGDGQQEIAVAPAAGGSAGNDFWVMKFDTQSRSWRHLSPIAGHPMGADMDASALGFPAKFAVVGDFDGDGQQEIAVAPEAGSSAGNDFWVMKFDTQSRSWRHLSPIAGHPMGADVDISGLGVPARFAVVGDFDGDQRQEIAAAADAGASAGNDFWVIKFDPQSRSWRHLSPIAGHPTQADIDCSTLAFPAKFAIAADFDGDGRQEMAVAPSASSSAGNDFWVMKYRA